MGGFTTPDDRSGANSPYYLASALASSEDLTQASTQATTPGTPGTPNTPGIPGTPDAMAALTSRLQRMTDARSRRNSVVSLESAVPHAEGLSRTISAEDIPSLTSASASAEGDEDMEN
ncbi:hypothetical protein IMZ48_17965, partial [Candidatus Bathyarchaeota archaeon]|nr:hypothetical protein [Candidatus Bathyarchaeota archaeon]